MRASIGAGMRYWRLRGITMTTNRRGARRRLATIALISASALTLVACGDDAKDDPPRPTATASVPTPKEQVEAAYQRYWDVYVQLSNSGDIDSAAFTGVAEGSFVESTLKNLRDQAESGVVRVGEPTFSTFRTEVEGRKATSLVCLDERKWAAKHDDKTLPPPSDADPSPIEATLEQRDGGWIVTDLDFRKGETCPSAK